MTEPGRIADTLQTLVDAMLEAPNDKNQTFHLTRSDIIGHDKNANCICGPLAVNVTVGEAAAVIYMHHTLLAA